MRSDISLRGDWMSTLTHNKVLYNSKSLAAENKNFFSSQFWRSVQSNAKKKKYKWKHSHLLCLCVRSLKSADVKARICHMYNFFHSHNTVESWRMDVCGGMFSLFKLLHSNDIILWRCISQEKNISRHVHFSHIWSFATTLYFFLLKRVMSTLRPSDFWSLKHSNEKLCYIATN